MLKSTGRALLLALTLIIALVSEASSQESPASSATSEAISEACSASEHRGFDFWLGAWTVSTDEGVAGSNNIVRIADGCALHENWRSSEGNTGTSINMYDPIADEWTQVWVGGNGLILYLKGGLEDGKMVLTGEPRQGRDGPVTDRITWTPMDDGRVRQLWEISNDDRATWQVVFDGKYARQ